MLCGHSAAGGCCIRGVSCVEADMMLINLQPTQVHLLHPTAPMLSFAVQGALPLLVPL
jgi:hypothetical protein